jgi:hypothetical protein
VFLTLAYVVFAVITIQWTGPKLKSYSNGAEPIDLIFSYTIDQVYTSLKSYGPEGREWYTLIELTIGIIYPVIYSVLLSLLIVFTYIRLMLPENLIKIIFLLPIITLFIDFLENACIIFMLINYPYKLDLAAQLASTLTNTKWIMLILCVTLVLTGGLILIIRYVRFKLIVKSVSR